jgi:hypothetical protein
MHDLGELIHQTQGLQEQIDALHQPLEQLQIKLRVVQEKIATLFGRPEGAVAGTISPGSDPGLPLSAHAQAAVAEEPDRRTIPRRGGNPTPVLLTCHEAKHTVHGWVLDRSPDGLSLLAEESVPIGTRMQVQPVHPHANGQRFQVEVRNCRPERTIWILGCQFQTNLSWTNLRLFG